MSATPAPPGARDLLLASRPVSWINTALPFLAAAFEETRALTPLVLLGTAFFLLPYNLLLYGINDLFDYASDVANPRKGSAEGGLVSPAGAGRLAIAIVATNLPPLVLLAWLAGPVAAGALALTVLVAIAYSAPPLRTKERPILDSATSALHFVLPAACGFLVAGGDLAELPWLALGGFLAWGMASHAVGAIQDIAYDRAAGIGSIATALGPRPTAAFALAGYLVACAVASGVAGPSASVALAALAPYLLLPAMVLARPDEAQARRAWRSFMGLNLVAGFVLTQALLRHWGITSFGLWELSVAAASGAAAIVLVNVTLTWLTTRPPRAAVTPDRPGTAAVTVVVPARNESARIAPALAALVAQRGVAPLEVLVVDDGSTDDTAAVARAALAPLGMRARVLSAPRRGHDWNGKASAAAHGVALARTPLVLVLDADTVVQPDAVRRIADAQARSGAGLVSGVTRYAMDAAWERVLMPGFGLLLFGFVPVWWSAVTRGRGSPLPFAYGPLELVARDAYLATGGHGATPASAREDVDLARTFARAGHPVATIHAADLATTRHYASPREALGAWVRIMPSYAGGSVAIVLAAILGQVLAFGVPVVLPLAALALEPGWLPATLVPLALLVAARLVLARTQRQPILTVALHPLTVLVTLAAHVAALVALVAGRPIRWRGRTVGEPTGPAAAAQGRARPDPPRPTGADR